MAFFENDLLDLSQSRENKRRNTFFQITKPYIKYQNKFLRKTSEADKFQRQISKLWKKRILSILCSTFWSDKETKRDWQEPSLRFLKKSKSSSTSQLFCILKVRQIRLCVHFCWINVTKLLLALKVLALRKFVICRGCGLSAAI